MSWSRNSLVGNGSMSGTALSDLVGKTLFNWRRYSNSSSFSLLSISSKNLTLSLRNSTSESLDTQTPQGSFVSLNIQGRPSKGVKSSRGLHSLSQLRHFGSCLAWCVAPDLAPQRIQEKMELQFSLVSLDGIDIFSPGILSPLDQNSTPSTSSSNCPSFSPLPTL